MSDGIGALILIGRTYSYWLIYLIVIYLPDPQFGIQRTRNE